MHGKPSIVRFHYRLATDAQIRVFVVKDLATRFADGRLSTQKLMQADDEELARMLIEVRGIGRVRGYTIFSYSTCNLLSVA